MGKRKSYRKTPSSNDVKKAKTEKANEQNDEGSQQEESCDIKTSTCDGRSSSVKICSWNVAGLKAWVKKDGLGYLQEENADIVCLQETKCLEGDLPSEVLRLKNGAKITGKDDSGYYMYWCSAEKKGYSGVSLWSKTKPLNVKKGLGIKEHDMEGRLITAEYETFYVVTSYVPNSGRKLVRLDYRREWNTALKDYLKTLSEKKHVVFCGDLNVAHKEIDIANPKSNRRSAGFTDEEREDFSDLLSTGFMDSYRHLHPETTGSYTYWTYIGNARGKNVGWRLDYFVLSKSLEGSLCDNVIRSKVLGSDHCPIVLDLAV